MRRESVVKARINNMGILLLLVLVLTFSALIVSAENVHADVVDSGDCGDKLTWVLDDEGTPDTYTLTISGTGAMTDYAYMVKPPWDTNDSKITKVIIGDGVTTVGNYAFSGCSALADLSLPTSLTGIGGNSFSNCSALQEVTLPQGLESIGDSAFYYCTNLELSSLPDSVKTLGRAAFQYCQKLQGPLDLSNLTSLGAYAFQQCVALDNVILPSSLKTIPEFLFDNCSNLKTVMMSDSVTEVANSAFRGCTNLTSVVFSNNITSIGYQNDPLIALAVNALDSNLTVEIKGYRPGIGDYAGQLQEVTLLESGQIATGEYMYKYSDEIPFLYEDTDTSSAYGNDDGIRTQAGKLYPRTYYIAPEKDKTSFSVSVYKTEDHQLKLVAQGTRNVTPTSQSGEALVNSLANLSVLMVEGETKTLGQLLGRAGLAHVNCDNVRIPDITDFTEAQTAIVELSKSTGNLRTSSFTAMSPGMVDAIFKVYSTGCLFQGTQFSEDSPYDATLTLIVIGEPTDTPDLRKATITIPDIPDDLPEGSVVKVTLNGETKAVTVVDGTGTAEFTGLEPDTVYPYSVDIGNDTMGYSRLNFETKTLVAAEFTAQPEDLTWKEGDNTPRSLSITAVPLVEGELTYQWYKVGENGEEEIITGATDHIYNISEPENVAAGVYKYFCRVTNSVDPDKPMDSDIGTVTVIAKDAVTIEATDKELTYSPEPVAIPVEGMFTIPDGAGEATYTVTPGTGEGTYDPETGTLTITKAGTFNIQVNTAETADYLAGQATATLTILKAEGTANVTLADQKAGTTDYEPALESEDYSTDAADVEIKYLKKDGDDYTELTEKPSEVGEYRVSVTFRENDLYVEKTVTSDFKIGEKSADEVTYDDLTVEEKADADKIAEKFDVDKDTAAKMLRTGEELGVPLDTMLLSTKALKELKNDKDPKGSRFAKLTARAVKRGKTTMRVQWKTLPDADGYLIYSNRCGKKLKLAKTIKNGKTYKWNRKKLKKARYYKYIVVAYKNIAGQKLPIAASVMVHCTTKAKTNTIAKTVKLNKKSLTLSVGSTKTLKGKEVKQEKGKIIRKHRKINFESLNPEIAKVGRSTGKVTGVAPGKTTIYVYCQNGVYKKVTVTVQ